MLRTRSVTPGVVLDSRTAVFESHGDRRQRLQRADRVVDPLSGNLYVADLTTAGWFDSTPFANPTRMNPTRYTATQFQQPHRIDSFSSSLNQPRAVAFDPAGTCGLPTAGTIGEAREC
jgi:hypothetical protein